MRTCGNCTACCRPLPILELQKSIGVWCTQCDQGVGCRIYDSRPRSCRDFSCQWLKGIGKEDDRPDKTRVILDFVQTDNGLPGGILQIWEVSAGRLDSPHVHMITDAAVMAKIWVSHIPLHGKKKKMFVPPNRVLTEEIRAALAMENFAVMLVRVR